MSVHSDYIDNLPPFVNVLGQNLPKENLKYEARYRGTFGNLELEFYETLVPSGAERRGTFRFPARPERDHVAALGDSSEPRAAFLAFVAQAIDRHPDA